MDAVASWISTVGGEFWTWVVLPVVVLLGLYLTLRSGVVQFRLIPEMFRTLMNKTPADENGRPQSASAFQAFTISAASRFGTGNIAGVGTAIAIGGPGAVFWMWLMAFIGAASAFAESTLAQTFKVKDADGFRGGPAYYMQRGMFSNEAGLGSAPNAGASAAVTHPVKQGLVQSLGVYFDTFLICSITAFIILTAVPDLGGVPTGIELTQMALGATLGDWALIALAVIVFLLAFSSIIGNYYYGESNLEFISTKRGVLAGYRVLVVVAVFVGSVLSADLVWNFADAAMGLMALTNLIAVALLSGIVFALLRDYLAQRRQGRDPVFTRERLPGVSGIECWNDEATVTGPLFVQRGDRR